MNYLQKEDMLAKRKCILFWNIVQLPSEIILLILGALGVVGQLARNTSSRTRGQPTHISITKYGMRKVAPPFLYTKYLPIQSNMKML